VKKRKTFKYEITLNRYEWPRYIADQLTINLRGLFAHALVSVKDLQQTHPSYGYVNGDTYMVGEDEPEKEVISWEQLYKEIADRIFHSDLVTEKAALSVVLDALLKGKEHGNGVIPMYVDEIIQHLQEFRERYSRISLSKEAESVV
jgi:hypothetical protein